MTKRIIALLVAALAVLGLAGVAFAKAVPNRATYGIDDVALSMATEPATADPGAAGQSQSAAPGQGPGGTGGRRDELKTCVKTKVDAGSARPAALKECVTQLGIKPGAHGGLRPLRQAVHAELVVPKKGAEGQWETVVVDRGKVSVASADSVSLVRPDGPTVTVKVVATTKVRGAASSTALTAGTQIAVVSAGGEARLIIARP